MPDSENSSDKGSLINRGANQGLGFLLMIVLAVAIGVAGGIFEARILFLQFDFVTFTLGPTIVFLLVGWALRAVTSNPHFYKGLLFGALSGCLIVVVVSFWAFLETLFRLGPA